MPQGLREAEVASGEHEGSQKKMDWGLGGAGRMQEENERGPAPTHPPREPPPNRS